MKAEDFLNEHGEFNEDAQPPPSLGACVDLYHEARELRIAMEKQIEAGIKKVEAAFREHLIANLSKSDDTGVAGKKYRAQIVMKRTFKVEDWGPLYSWIRKNDRFDMLEKRLSKTAASDWVDENKRLLPGVEAMDLPEISVRKV